ncbi:hypothetical protein HYE68_009047 [Fusarium pseudograminearum]|nr:hypothetical protein HYE68_009047 [Fusarium pseudograminearum]
MLPRRSATMAPPDLNDAQRAILRNAGMEELWGKIFENWSPGHRIPMPVMTIHTFVESSISIGRLKCNQPPGGDYLVPCPKYRKEGAIVYLAVKRDGNDNTAFLWCDKKGEPVKRSQIIPRCDVDIYRLKEMLCEDYNNNECYFIDEYNEAIKIAHGRTVLAFLVARAHRDGGRDRSTPHFCEETFRYKAHVFCCEDDPEINGDD